MNQNQLSDQRDNLFDKIEKYYKGEGKLSTSEQVICQRWELAFSLLAKFRSKKVAITKYQVILEQQGNPISLNTAYQDFQKAEAIFLPIHKTSKELQRLIIVESIDKNISKLESKQLSIQADHRLYLQYQSEITKLKDLRIKASGIMQEDVHVPDFSRIQMPDILVNVSPKVQSLLKLMAKRGIVDTTEMMVKFTQDAEIIKDDQESN